MRGGAASHAPYLPQASRTTDRRCRRRAHVGRPMADLANQVDVEMLLRRFYGRVFADDTLEEPFSELQEKGSSRIFR
jgi:hypothetical protein